MMEVQLPGRLPSFFVVGYLLVLQSQCEFELGKSSNNRQLVYLRDFGLPPHYSMLVNHPPKLKLNQYTSEDRIHTVGRTCGAKGDGTMRNGPSKEL